MILYVCGILIYWVVFILAGDNILVGGICIANWYLFGFAGNIKIVVIYLGRWYLFGSVRTFGIGYNLLHNYNNVLKSK